MIQALWLLDVNNASRYYLPMIQGFHCKDTQALFEGRRVARFSNFEAVALRKLQQLHAAAVLDFLRVPPGNRLEALSGDRAGQWSIRINGQWRLCFEWLDGHAQRVEIVDYH
jgi:proteic killer suppression protein